MKTAWIIAGTVIACVGIAAFITTSSSDPEKVAREMLAQADVTINGNRPWDITVHNKDLYTRVMQQGSLGLGEAYMDGWWDCRALDQFFYKILSADLDSKIQLNWTIISSIITAKLLNLQSKERAFEVGEKHYDISNNLFKSMLDARMVYSCGYWKNVINLDQAQEQKLDLLCKKLQLKPGMRVLDIGCGWGGFAHYAAQHYGVEVVGITVSQEQAQHARETSQGLPVTIRLQDYRDLNEQFDRVVSVGMFEHVGYKNYREFMCIAHACLKDDGLFLLHTIGGNVSMNSCDPWINTYIFPNGMLPSMAQISQAMEGLWIMEDWHNFGSDYDKTLMAWYDNFVNSWDTVRLEDPKKYDERFYRMWKYYLLSCAGLFRARKAQLWQIVMHKHGVPGGYTSIR